MPERPSRPTAVSLARVGVGAADVEVRGADQVVRIVGRAGSELSEILESVGPVGGIVLDLSRIEYMTSTAIGAIVWASKERRLVLAAPTSFVRRLLELAEVSRLISIASSVEEALTILARPAKR